MKQNAQAFSEAKKYGDTQFNERAFDRRINIYSGKILGLSFKSVVKSFQAQVWKNLQSQWSCLSQAQTEEIYKKTNYKISQLFLD